ncbi:MAG: ribosome biogenesis/translation initiation ATPase RLI [Candidatus Aenigmarchaeota archaeon]|nr:ribosome biogenesis/translation initiation ATPase RLI [Candidatus Aenigmarchaeota archaeon]
MTRVAIVGKDLCEFKKCKYVCMNVCPINRSEKKCIIKGEDGFPVIDENLCIGCGICVKRCDFNAIKIVNLPEELDEKPIVQFGPNSFRLFRLPIPKKGIVGLLGANGIGKTTALKILAGAVRPNLGNFYEEVDWKEIIRYYRGTEIQQYLEKLSKSEVRTVYKPQKVDLIPEQFSSIDELNIDKDIAKKLNIDLSKDLKSLSGGELQKIAIAHAFSQDADIYYIDEPSSFLDIKERMKVAKFIREQSLGKSIMIVEHDLAMLDYLADWIHIFYGVPGAFGIVSGLYGVKNGINAFLEGYLREENVKIREPITFTETIQREKGNEVLIKFSKLSKEYSSFTLTVEPGEIYKNEILGIIGGNALGKTTFAKILAGIEKVDGKIDGKLKISYKPQYISSVNFDGRVYDLLATVKDPFSDDFKPIISKLKLGTILQKSVNKLSGGELQRVAIALCLGRGADIYLLDEPSAYLDVDQRVMLIKLIRNLERTFVIIDHDILFISSIADRCMLFSGEGGKWGCAKMYSLQEGLNEFLKEVNITFRRDEETRRLKPNKPGSVKDREQRESGHYFASI